MTCVMCRSPIMGDAICRVCGYKPRTVSFMTKVRSTYSVHAAVQTTTLKWLQRFFGEDKMTKREVTPELVKDLKPFVLKKPTKLYRGLGWDEVADYDLTSTLPKAGDVIEYKDNSCSSWTPTPRAAWGYASNFDGVRIVLEAEINPKATIVDTDNLPKEILDTCERKTGEHAESREVIVAVGSHKAKLIYVGYFDDEGEWQETEVSPIITP